MTMMIPMQRFISRSRSKDILRLTRLVYPAPISRPSGSTSLSMVSSLHFGKAFGQRLSISQVSTQSMIIHTPNIRPAMAMNAR
jgi:hypothetical protein